MHRTRLPVEPDTILMDEPCSALDPIATGATEELMSFGDPSDARTEDHISGRFG